MMVVQGPLAAVNRVEACIKTAHPDDWKVMSPTVAAVRQLVYRERVETVTDALRAIEAWLEALNELREMEAALKGKEQHPKVKEALEKIAQARQHLALRQDTEASSLVDEVKGTLAVVKTRSSGLDGQGPVPVCVRYSAQRPAALRG
jgi:phosphoribosylaminoimidazole carboxylase (NCAIR synthetase)